MGSEYKTDVVCCKVTIAAQNKESATHVLHETRKLQFGLLQLDEALNLPLQQPSIPLVTYMHIFPSLLKLFFKSVKLVKSSPQCRSS